MKMMPPDVKDLLLVALAAPGFWELLKIIFAKTGTFIANRIAPDRKRKATLGEVLNEVRNVKTKQESQDKAISEMNTALKEVQQGLIDAKDNSEEQRAEEARTRILRFNDELLQHILHSQEYFVEILKDIDFYEDYCETHPHYSNTRAVMSIKNIKKTYESCMDKGSFL